MQLPVVQAPMAGGPSTPALAAAVSNAGGLGMLAAGYKQASDLADEIAVLREWLTDDRPFGVNLFAPPPAGPGPSAEVSRYAARLAPLAAAAGVSLGEPRFDDDAYAAKLDVVIEARPAVLSVAFGVPSEADVARLHAAGIAVWITITTLHEATVAVGVGADALIAQGAEAGGHRGGFRDDDHAPASLPELLTAVLPQPIPVIAAGGIMDGAGTQRALAAGAAAVQCGTAYLRSPEAGTSEVHRQALGTRETVLTRAFSGRRARGIANGWIDAVGPAAPRAYPEIHHLTAPLRAHGRSSGDPDLVNLWAGTGHAAVEARPAAEITRLLATTG